MGHWTLIEYLEIFQEDVAVLCIVGLLPFGC